MIKVMLMVMVMMIMIIRLKTGRRLIWSSMVMMKDNDIGDANDVDHHDEKDEMQNVQGMTTDLFIVTQHARRLEGSADFVV